MHMFCGFLFIYLTVKCNLGSISVQTELSHLFNSYGWMYRNYQVSSVAGYLGCKDFFWQQNFLY